MPPHVILTRNGDDCGWRCGHHVSSSTVGRLARRLAEERERWRQRQLGEIPYLILHARYAHVRQGTAVGVALPIVIGIAVGAARAAPRRAWWLRTPGVVLHLCRLRPMLNYWGRPPRVNARCEQPSVWRGRTPWWQCRKAGGPWGIPKNDARRLLELKGLLGDGRKSHGSVA